MREQEQQWELLHELREKKDLSWQQKQCTGLCKERTKHMKVIDVYKQYFSAECEFNGVKRRAAVVTLTATSDAGTILYEVGVSFFPHRDEEDYAVSYDAISQEELFSGKGRRSKKREKEYLADIRTEADKAAEKLGGRIFWDKPLRDAQFG